MGPRRLARAIMATKLAKGKLKFSHGGARPGAGRKSAGTVPMLIRPLAATAGKLRAAARAEGRSIGQVVDGLVVGRP